ncbi:Tryptophan--tRNA ligase, mitochondrial [Eumeta japonica]|uniref:tryptophan--tRNA ligase n=1 Tax=Eumeta variegata TaxID=151549 RepID=A0A4C1TPD4_EUMVA|nr:Tryptophan--tRNA ligase, mitochondrial [Eumeta japonica]
MCRFNDFRPFLFLRHVPILHHWEAFVTTTNNLSDEEWPRRVLSGIQPTGGIHLGNYFGAVRRWVELQDTGDDLMICIADLHSLTTYQDPQILQQNILELTAYLLASGIDPERSILFLQSSVPRHSELCWILTCMATYARLAHLPQYKEKSATIREVPLGLLLYPVLQAADVLLYRATHVPVGVDQLQHLQVATQLVRTFHHRYGRVFPTPIPLLSDDDSVRLKSLRDPSKKMSKSDPNTKSRIMLSDSDEAIMNKIKRAVTDFTPQITYDPETRPGVSNLVAMHCLSTDKVPEEVVEEVDGIKKLVGECICSVVAPIRERAQQLLARPALLRDVLRVGTARARTRADQTYEDVARLVGVGIPTPSAHILRSASQTSAP